MSKRTLVAGTAVAAAGALAAVFFSPTDAIGGALHDLRGASPTWLAAAGLAFLAASFCSAAAWHRGLAACGSTLGRWQVTRRYAAGSLANTLAPANAGEVVRVALLSRAMGSEGAAFSVIGVSIVVGVMRASIVAGLFFATAATKVPVLWLGAGVCALVAVAAVALRLARARVAGKVQHVLDVVRGLRAKPLAALEMAGWIGTGTASAIFASACVGAALGLPHPVAAALVIIPAIELAKALPITPGNVGITSAAVAVALQSQGVPLESAVAAGITLHAVETVVGLSWGAAGALSLAPALQQPFARLRPRLAWAIPGAAPTAVLMVAFAMAAFGAYTALA